MKTFFINNKWCQLIARQRYFSYKAIQRPVFHEKQTKNTKSVKNEAQPNLSEQLKARIKAAGPITVAQYMKEVLTNPASGYYMSRDVFGQKGDFITSPEVGQIFGELVAVWLYSEWKKIGSPKPFQLIEFGPGRGTLSQDVIRVLSHLQLSKHMSLHLIEVSPFLSQLQSQRICFKTENVEPNNKDISYYKQGETISGIPVFWYRNFEDVPCNFSIILAHEFFDCLPIHKFQKTENKWREILIDIDTSAGNKFRFVLPRAETAMLQLFLKNIDLQDSREHIEYSIETDQLIENISTRLEEHGGFSLIMDYGHYGDKTDTFRAFKNHELHDPLLEPGSADITADVDFKQIQKIAVTNNKLITFGPVEQRDFLTRLGGDVRLEILTKNVKPDDAEILKSGYDMLTNPQKMGSRFKFFSMFPSVLDEHLKRFPINGFS